jgi:hypothetical protein
MQAVMLDVHCNAIAMRGVAKSAQQRSDRALNVCRSMKHVEINLRMLATKHKIRLLRNKADDGAPRPRGLVER